ncbi:hypothetical protein [Flagellimonas eckloniae]|uniref:hypothetical protein n=1 Tax=Flagellimonas eckloniae TaxID=346185 RepID=UPI0006DBF929|nr:hypothetical protein [Allomuricauda eckloniae]
MNHTRIINHFGKVAGWNSVTCRLLGRDVIGITELMYKDSMEIEGVKGAGPFDIGVGEGNYNAEASITLTQEERLALLDSLPPGKRIQDIDAFPIIAAYDYTGTIYKDVIRACRFKNNGVEVKQGDKSIAFKFELYTPAIDYNV